MLVLPNTGREVTSQKFTSPLKLFTYMASGVPIVASDLPALREVISENTAYLVTPDSPDALAQVVIEVLRDPQEAARRAQGALRAVAEYTWESRAEKILQFLQRN